MINTILVGTRPFAVAFSPDGTRAYVANSSSDTVSVIDTTSNTVTATIAVGDAPIALAVTPDGTRVYVANQRSHNVSVINTADNTVITTVAVGFFPSGVAITPNGASVYVTNQGSGNVSVISTATNTVTAVIPTSGSCPFGIAITAGSTQLVPSAATVSVSGRVLSPKGRGVANARVTLTGSSGETLTTRTNNFGYYQFSDVIACDTVIIGVSSKLYEYPTQVLNLSEETNGLNFVPQNSKGRIR